MGFYRDRVSLTQEWARWLWADCAAGLEPFHKGLNLHRAWAHVIAKLYYTYYKGVSLYLGSHI